MNTTLAKSIITPQVGELWLPINEGGAVVITGVIAEDTGDEVYFSTLSSVAQSAALEDFVEHFSKRVYSL